MNALFLSLLSVGPVIANGHSYDQVVQADIGSIGKHIVRYLVFSGSPCIVVQTMVPGDGGKIVEENTICSLEGKSFWDGYADIYLRKAEFASDKLYFDMSVTPLYPTGEEIRVCEVLFEGLRADRLECDGVKEFDYRNVRKSEVGEVGGYDVRYLTAMNDPCITVETFTLGKSDRALARNTLCDLEGKDLYRHYKNVQLLDAKFSEGKLFFSMSVTPRASGVEQFKYCQVVFEGVKADRLECKPLFME